MQAVAKRITACAALVAMVLALCIAWAPSAFAMEESTEIWVGGTKVTSANAADVLGDGTVAYDDDSKTLTLTNASIECKTITIGGEYPQTICAGIDVIALGDFKVVLVGDNSITFDGDVSRVMTVVGIGHNLGNQSESDRTPEFLIAGEGTLDISLASLKGFDEVYAAFAENGEGSSGNIPTYYAFAGSSDNTVFDGGCSITSRFGDGVAPFSSSGSFFSGMLFEVRDATINHKAGACMSQSGFNCAEGVMDGNANVAMTLNAGAGGVTGFGGSALKIGGNADVTFHVTGRGQASGASGGLLQIADNARISLVAKGFEEGSSGQPQTYGYGGTVGEYKLLGNGTLEAAGTYAALTGGTLDMSGHAIGTAYVSNEFSYPASNLSLWDGETSLLQRGATPYLYVRVPGEPLVKRVAGDYANETAAAIADSAFLSSEWVVIARDDDFADALGATGLAGTLGCPIVLTDRFALSEAAADEIAYLGATKAYVIGGTGAIKEQVDTDLEALGVEVQPRIWGENSYDTSLACAKEIVKLGGDNHLTIVAMSTNFQDALSISPIAYSKKVPLILQTWGDTAADRGFTDEAKEFLAGTAPLVVGGPGAISDESLEGIAFGMPPVRLYGETGYDTSNVIAKKMVEEWYYLSDSAVVFACGAQAPKGVDALAGSALAGKLGCPILLVNGNDAMEAVDTTTIDGYFASHANECKDVYVLGGAYVMPQDLVDKITALFN